MLGEHGCLCPFLQELWLPHSCMGAEQNRWPSLRLVHWEPVSTIVSDRGARSSAMCRASEFFNSGCQGPQGTDFTTTTPKTAICDYTRISTFAPCVPRTIFGLRCECDRRSSHQALGLEKASSMNVTRRTQSQRKVLVDTRMRQARRSTDGRKPLMARALKHRCFRLRGRDSVH